MNIIFLDVDGVLNSGEFREERYKILKRAVRTEEFFDPTCMECLREIVEATDAKIVITSSMLINDMELLKNKLGEYNIKLYDKTKYYGDMRGAQIREWLAEHDNVKNYIILDDDYFIDYPGLDEHIVKTSFYSGKGLNKSHVPKAIKLLKRS
ncbi:MAG: hypothetical protein J6A15_04370 [Clostridia bacterium]|nr:hypothetical protein [Clostridia bacterium]